MPKIGYFILPLLAALALVVGPRPAVAQAPGWRPAPLLVAQRHRPRDEGGQIACRRGGCFRVPPGCHPEIEFDFWGNATGYDKIVCPGR